MQFITLLSCETQSKPGKGLSCGELSVSHVRTVLLQDLIELPVQEELCMSYFCSNSAEAWGNEEVYQ